MTKVLIFLSHLLLTIGISLLLVSLSFRLVRNHYIETLTMDLEKIAVALENTIHPYLVSGDFVSLDSHIKNMGKRMEVRVNRR